MYPVELFVSPILTVVSLFLLAFLGTDASEIRRSAEPAAPIELNRQEMESELAQLLYQRTVAFPPKDPAEAREVAMRQAMPVYSFHSKIGAGGVLLSETTVRFENCVLVERLQRPDAASRDLKTIRETRRHLALLDTDPTRIETKPWMQSSPGQNVIVEVPFRGDVRDRLNALNERASAILREAYDEFPQNVPERLLWLKTAYEERLEDKIYQYASDTDYQDGEAATTSPLSGHNRFTLPRMRAEQFIYLLDAYRNRHCTADPAIDQ